MKYPFGLSLARKCFKKFPWKRKRVVACYINGGTILISSNLDKTHPESPAYSCTTHAEHAVLKRVGNGTGGKIFIYREQRNGNSALSKPCLACKQKILDKNIKICYYSTESGFIKEKFI